MSNLSRATRELAETYGKMGDADIAGRLIERAAGLERREFEERAAEVGQIFYECAYGQSLPQDQAQQRAIQAAGAAILNHLHAQGNPPAVGPQSALRGAVDDLLATDRMAWIAFGPLVGPAQVVCLNGGAAETAEQLQGLTDRLTQQITPADVEAEARALIETTDLTDALGEMG